MPGRHIRGIHEKCDELEFLAILLDMRQEAYDRADDLTKQIAWVNSQLDSLGWELGDVRHS